MMNTLERSVDRMRMSNRNGYGDDRSSKGKKTENKISINSNMENVQCYKCHKCHNINNANKYFNKYNAYNRNVPKRQRS